MSLASSGNRLNQIKNNYELKIALEVSLVYTDNRNELIMHGTRDKDSFKLNKPIAAVWLLLLRA
jgi:hypothetical protein